VPSAYIALPCWWRRLPPMDRTERIDVRRDARGLVLEPPAARELRQ